MVFSDRLIKIRGKRPLKIVSFTSKVNSPTVSKLNQNQHERELIGERTRAALKAKKAQGFTLGTPNLTPAISEQGRRVHQANTRTHPANVQAAELIRLYRNEGLTYQAIAHRLNQMGFRTRRGEALPGHERATAGPAVNSLRGPWSIPH